VNADLFKRLITVPGISGREERVRDLVIKELTPLVDEVRVDRLGNVIGRKDGERPRVMLCAHMDTIGFLVSHVDDDGFLRISPVGGFDPRTLPVQRVLVQGKKDFVGLVSAMTKPIHLLEQDDMKKAPKIEDLFVDLMLDADEVKENVSVGDPVTLYREAIVTERAVTAPYLDDRLGVYVLIEALRKADGVGAEVYAVISVQEEVGVRGAHTSAFGIDPDVGVALDITLSVDVPGTDKPQRVTTTGKGAAIGLMDSLSISDPRLVDHFKRIAGEKSIAHQTEVMLGGGTDAGAMQLSRSGVAAVTISVPVRYVHTANEMALIEDIDATVALMAGWLEAATDLDLDWGAPHR
jgi:putative aminopeptidase FrvX